MLRKEQVAAVEPVAVPDRGGIERFRGSTSRRAWRQVSFGVELNLAWTLQRAACRNQRTPRKRYVAPDSRKESGPVFVYNGTKEGPVTTIPPEVRQAIEQAGESPVQLTDPETTQNQVEPLKDGKFVKILNSGYHRARIAEYRGPLGPKGARVYRVLVQKKPRRVYIEVLEDQLEVLDDARGLPPAGS
jgi:hypothetical protein